MVKRKSGKGGGGKESEHIISFTPSAGFDIRKAAQNLKELMEDLEQPLVIHLSDVSVEYEVGCTRKQIIDGYNQALKAVRASNTN